MTTIQAKQASFFHDVSSVARRALRLITRDLESVMPALIVPVFFFAVNTGSLQKITETNLPGFDIKAFQLPVSIIFAVTGISRAANLVLDIQNGYFDRLLMTPLNRRALLLGLMVADFVLVVALAIPVLCLGLIVGVHFTTGILGMLAFILLAGLWGLMFTGFPYAIALKTGSPAAVNSSFLLFFPFAFLTTSFVPKEALSGWMGTIATYNPVTYILGGLRSLISTGWQGDELAKALLAIICVGVVSQFLAFKALRGRLKSG